MEDIQIVPVIDLDSDGESINSGNTTTGRNEYSSPASSLSPSSSFRRDDFMSDEDFEAYINCLSGNDGSPSPPRRTARRSRITQAQQALPPRTQVSEITYQGRTYRPGKYVELHYGTFLRINRILSSMQETVISGPKFERLETMGSLMPDRPNELCWIVDQGDCHSSSSSNLQYQPYNGEVEVPLSAIRRVRIIRMTNKPYTRTTDQCRDDDFLFCRMKFIRTWERSVSASGRSAAARIVEETITFVSPEQCQPAFSVSTAVLRMNWRGVVPSRRRYTFGDGFCGAGGVSRGAQQAGLRLSWAFDHSPSAMNSYRANFPSSLAETSDVADFLTNRSLDIRIDVLHLSPPCQPFSPAKTIAAAHDDANEACLFSVRRLIEKCRPRVVTMEETSGLKERHEIWLHAIIHSLVELGYSVRWRLVNCKDYGVPQSRRRLVIIASGPGEELPNFPLPTHGDEPGQLPPVTILDAISGIPSTAPDHDLERAERPFHRPPYNPCSLAKTLTCSGGDNFHPSGTRTFTLREAASLQTFPLHHTFCGPGVMKQIGNAVPPVLARAVFEEVIKSLKNTDAAATESDEPITID
ncbi:modification methylase HphIA [Nannizzia gypsea CBS 118893]|uniref:DNA (cytosine-5-)-methyltransferase n=1 Tax=Arthroderma gypseum (strain ATCC MYA-4604 / CBS 118893) TaxID=535722 RepID=E5QYC9_ARTGP|nr:modification methylase HphIA [Nannizzia gypsea CBS 118893]EFQ97221.1 modification methylase HphIA [Nannizzia gypsea CBS 118893]